MTSLLTETDIQRVVDHFYPLVRQDSLLGPVFMSRIEDTDTAWHEHQNHIADFWSSIFLKTRRFNGNPMTKHAGLAEITPEHFTHWLELFGETAQVVLSEAKANTITEMAQRIARSLQMGLAFSREKAGEFDHSFSAYSALPKHLHSKKSTS